MEVMKGAIAHELVGHRAAELAGKTHPNIVLDRQALEQQDLLRN